MDDAELIAWMREHDYVPRIKAGADRIESLSARLKVAEEGLQHIAEYGRANPGHGYSCATKALSVLSQFRKEVG